MNTQTLDTLNNIAVDYIKVIKAFKNRTDVLNGTAIGYHDNQDPKGKLRLENKPHSIGEGLTTTGYCVSASQALLYDNAFEILLQKRNAKAKLVSIDIKEQFWGRCYNDVRNTWHTAILVNDSGINFIIDLTCAQFGNRYVEKFIWNFETWESTFRAANCKHTITDFNGNVLSFQPVEMKRSDSIDVCSSELCDLSGKMFYDRNKEEELNELKHNFEKIVSLDEEEICFIADYFINNFDNLNRKILLGNINSLDNKYIDKLNSILQRLPFKSFKETQYSAIKFPNKKTCLKFIENLHKSDYLLTQYMLFSDDMEKACKMSGINIEKINKEYYNEDSEVYLIFKLNDVSSICLVDLVPNTTTIIPFGIRLSIDMKNGGIYNANKLQHNDTLGVEPQKTNTIYIEANLD